MCPTPLITAPRSQRHADLCEFKTSLVHKVSSRTARFYYTEKPCLKKQPKQKNNSSRAGEMDLQLRAISHSCEELGVCFPAPCVEGSQSSVTLSSGFFRTCTASTDILACVKLPTHIKLNLFTAAMEAHTCNLRGQRPTDL